MGLVVITAGWVGLVGSAHAQALAVEKLASGAELVHVALPLAEATSVAWPERDDQGQVVVRSLVGGPLTLAADLESALGDATKSAPPVVVAVGGAATGDLRAVLDRLLAGRPLTELPVPATGSLVEGGTERRLGPAGGDATLRLSLPLPEPSNPDRTSVEVLFEVLPELMSRDAEGLQSRIEGDLGVLEGRIDPDLAELRLARVRLALARLAEAPQLDEALVERARIRVAVRRLAQLERHPEAAEELLRRWLVAGDDGVRERLFGTEGVTVEGVRTAALAWLPRHPGAATLVLPPQVFNPRFAPPPARVELDNDLSAVVLERGATPLAALVLRPVLVPDVDGALSATVLTRLAVELRSGDAAPGWVRVHATPPSLELAAPADAFAELVEAVQDALARVVQDDLPVTVSEDSRRRALAMVGDRLGLSGGAELTPAALLRPSNLALGAVVPDAESAGEALAKFMVGGPAPEGAVSRASGGVGRQREAVPGRSSTVAVALDVEGPPGPALRSVTAELLAARLAASLPGRRGEVLTPLVPGRSVLVVLVSGDDATVDDLERELAGVWSKLVAAPDEAELAPVRRRVAARLAADSGGTLGRAGACAALAAGAQPWQNARELELETLGLEPEAVGRSLAGAADLAGLETAAAGVLPIVPPEDVAPRRRR